MVQMNRARIYHPATKTYAETEITAKEYAARKDEMIAREEAGEIECHCPDPHCDGVRVGLRAEHLHTYYGNAGHAYRLEIPDYFARRRGAKEHHPDCNIAQEYAGFRRIVAAISELKTGHQSFMINMNIPTYDLSPPQRKVRANVDEAFEKAAQSKYRRDSLRPRRAALSHSLNSIHGLGSLIERAAYDDRLQRNTMIHVDGKILALKEFYRETPVSLFLRGRDVLEDASDLARARLTHAYFPAATVFHPAPPREFWVIDKKEGPGTIFGQVEKKTGRDGKSYNVNTVLHVGNRDLYYDLQSQFHKGYKSFLVVSEKNTVDRDEIRRRNQDARASNINYAFQVHTHVNVAAQIAPWTPPPDIKEMDLGGSMFDLREPPHQKKWRAEQAAKRKEERNAARAALNEAQFRLI